MNHLRAIVALPVTVAILVPALVLRFGPATTGWVLPPCADPARLVIGFLSVGLGLYLLVSTILLLARVGRGTLAPWAPPRRLVVRGAYRHTRNPMITGVFGVLFGEALLLSSTPLLGWFLGFVLLNLIYIPVLEEPGLERRFGEAYRTYKRNVPRWIPRLRPWTPGRE
jgi:protein-S-isoprenylcysteine O-methyltransferase Ste14